mgnify:CR=1 FL=1
MLQIEELYNQIGNLDRIRTDSRLVQKGDVFWVLVGERLDGHAFIDQALARGAALVVCSRIPEAYAQDERIRYSPDTLKSLQELARHHIRQFNLRRIALTGSNGKTTTRRLAATMLQKKYKVFATPGNKNNHIGLPLSILQIRDQHEIALLELGANHPGENALLADIVRPEYGLVTNTGKDHLEGFEDEAGVVRANLELFDHLQEHGGAVWVDRGQNHLMEAARARHLVLYTYAASWEEKDDLVQGVILEPYPTLKVQLRFSDGSQPIVQTQLFGDFQLQNILAASAMAYTMGVSAAQIAERLQAFRSGDNRTEMIPLQGGGLLVLDAYNANPSSMRQAIKSFAFWPRKGRDKWLILGDMLEMGKHEAAEHQTLIDMLRKHATCFDRILLVGSRLGRYARRGMETFANYQELHTLLVEDPQWTHVRLLVKGSRSMALERAFEGLLPDADPDPAH